MIKMIKMIKCSVIVPAYNVAHYIENCIYSIVSQTLKDIEIIVVDDSSTDNTCEIVRKLSEQDNRIKLIVHEENKGAPCARNTGLKIARGEWVAFVDADDWMDAERLERLIAFGEDWMADMVADDVYIVDFSICQYKHFSENKMYVNPEQIYTLFDKNFKRKLPRFLHPSEFILGNLPGPRNPRLGLIKPIIHHAFIQKYSLQWREDVLVSQDIVFYFDCLMHGAKLLLIPQAFYYYLQSRPSSITASVGKIDALRDRLRITDTLIKEYGTGDQNILKALHKRRRRLIRMLRYSTFKANFCEYVFFKEFKSLIMTFVYLYDFAFIYVEKRYVWLTSRIKALFRHIERFLRAWIRPVSGRSPERRHRPGGPGRERLRRGSRPVR